MKNTARAELTAKTNLIVLKNGTPVVSHKIIAEKTGNEPRAVKQMIEKYLANLKEFGQLTFEMTTVKNSVGAVNQTKEYLLNEDQAIFLMTLLKNTKQVVEFKLNLVKEFSKLRNTQLQLNLEDKNLKNAYEKQKYAINLLVQSGLEYEKELDELRTIALKQEEQLEELRKKLEKNKALQKNIAKLGINELKISIEDLAKELGMSKRKLYSELRYKKYLKLNNKPYKNYIGKLFVLEDMKYINGTKHSYKKTFVTSKGIEFFKRLFSPQVLLE